MIESTPSAPPPSSFRRSTLASVVYISKIKKQRKSKKNKKIKKKERKKKEKEKMYEKKCEMKRKPFTSAWSRTGEARAFSFDSRSIVPSFSRCRGKWETSTIGGASLPFAWFILGSFFFRAAEPSSFTRGLNCDFLEVLNVSLHFPTKRSRFLPRDVHFFFFFFLNFVVSSHSVDDKFVFLFSATGAFSLFFFSFFFSWKRGGMLFHCPETDLRNKS